MEAALQANGVTESDVKEVIKKQLANAPKRKGDEKTEMMQMIELIRPMCRGNFFYGLILGYHDFIFSYAQAHKNLKFSFWGHFIFFFPHKVIFPVILEVSRV